MDDYYPFGLTFNSYQRENSVDQRWKFQGQEHIEDLGLNWDSFKWRNHQPDIGRFLNVAPLAESFYHNSPYAFSENKVTNHIELEGLEAYPAQQALNREIKKVENVVMDVVDGVVSVVNSIGDGIAGAWSSIGPGQNGGGFTLSSENGGVTGGTDEGVREGQGDRMLEVGHLLTPDTRSDATNLVQGVEEETHIIQNATTTTIDNVTDGTGKEISLDVTVVKDTVLDAEDFNQYEVTLPSGKDSVIQRTNNPEEKKDQR